MARCVIHEKYNFPLRKKRNINKKNFLCVRFMEEDYSSNVHAGLEKSVRFMGCPLQSVRFGDVLLYGIPQEFVQDKIFCPSQRGAALEDFRFREVALYLLNSLKTECFLHFSIDIPVQCCPGKVNLVLNFCSWHLIERLSGWCTHSMLARVI